MAGIRGLGDKRDLSPNPQIPAITVWRTVRDWRTFAISAPKAAHALDFAVRACYNAGVVTRGGAEVARRAHNPKVVGSNPTPATNFSSMV